MAGLTVTMTVHRIDMKTLRQLRKNLSIVLPGRSLTVKQKKGTPLTAFAVIQNRPVGKKSGFFGKSGLRSSLQGNI